MSFCAPVFLLSALLLEVSVLRGGDRKEKIMPHSQNLPFRTNQLLAALPDDEYQRLLPSLEVVSFNIKDGLYHPDKIIEYVYFPLSGMASILVVMGGDQLVEVAVVGREGMVGVPVFLGAEKTITDAFYQVAGEVARMPSDLFRAEVKHGGRFVHIMQQYAQAYFAMLAQNIGCSSQHNINKRCARWLLQAHNRAGGNEFELTHELLSQMLGVRRAGVTTIMQKLEKTGVIRYSRGKVTIVDRAGLESAACECYQIITNEYKRLLG